MSAGVDSPGVTQTPRQRLAEHIAGQIALSEDPGATLRKWRTEFDVPQSDLAAAMDVSASVVSDYESGRRANPGIEVVQRYVGALLDVDEARGGDRIRQYAQVLSAGFESDVVHDLREYPAAVSHDRIFDAIDATQVVDGDADRSSGHTVIDSIRAITRLSSDEFYRLYGQSTNRVLVFTGITRGESPLVAIRVVSPTPNAVVLHGIDADDLWEHAPDLARIDGVTLAVTTTDREEMIAAMRDLP